ncbi:MAG: MoaD/ThiS family protein [Deltaproteobacteria bacterium]|nr:MoaD/ThiS family protein [Deltaproteobacteria bacterium]
MRVTVEPTYEMTKLLKMYSFEVEVADAATVADVVEKTKTKVGPEFDKLVRLAAVAVNGVLVSHQRGMKTRLADGDAIRFVKASAGG